MRGGGGSAGELLFQQPALALLGKSVFRKRDEGAAVHRVRHMTVRFADKSEFVDATTRALEAVEHEAARLFDLAHIAHNVASTQRENVDLVTNLEVQGAREKIVEGFGRAVGGQVEERPQSRNRGY